jgi:hypothetical protein
VVDQYSVNAEMKRTEFAGFLEGIGFREQELQQAKGKKFISELPRGVTWSSFGGGTNTFLKGSGLADNPQSNLIVMMSPKDPKWEGLAPKLTEDDAFLSSPDNGFITYRMSAPHVIMNMRENLLDTFDSLTFYVSVTAIKDNEPEVLECDVKLLDRCKIRYYRSYTPVLYYMSPPVVYFDAITQFTFDPKSTTNTISDLQTDELPFINGKIANALVDFTDNVDSSTGLSHWRKNSLSGRVGD